MADYISKARYWMAILYPENMVDNWQDSISSLLQVPYCYIIHDKDLCRDGEQRKVHVHIMIALANTTTYGAALSIFKTLQAPDRPSPIPNDEIRQVRFVRNVYDYFIHNTEESRKLNKHLYQASDRHCGNGFDIGSYEQLGQAEKDQMLLSITDFIFDHNIENFADLVYHVRNSFDDEYFSIVKSNANYFQALTRGVFHQMERNRKDKETKRQEYQLAITRHHKKQRKKSGINHSSGYYDIKKSDV